MVSGKPKAKILSEGAERVITPITMFKIKRTDTTGIISCAASRNILVVATMPASIRIVPLIGVPMGRVRQLSRIRRMTARWPSSVTKMASRKSMKNWPITGDCVPVEGSTCAARPRPAVLAIRSPAMTAAAKRICSTIPAESPIASSRKAMTTLESEASASGAGIGT